MRAGKSRTTRVSSIVNVLPLATTPAMCSARPARYARTPTMSAANAGATAADPSFGLKLRSIVDLNVAAVTRSFEGGENLKPSRILNV